MARALRFGSTLSFLALASLTAGCATPQSHVRTAGFGGKANEEVGLATRAMAALNSNNIPMAIDFAQRAVEKTPNDAGFRALLGSAYFAGGRFKSAEGAYKDSLSLYSNQPQVVLKLALVEIALGKNSEALAFLNAGREVLDPADYGLAVALAGQGLVVPPAVEDIEEMCALILGCPDVPLVPPKRDFSECVNHVQAALSSPDAVTPYHFDPEHNILMQLVGTKTMTQFPAGDPKYAPDRVHETYHTGGARELKWDDEFLAEGTEWAMQPGDALFVPVMAPHFVKNGPTPSISLSITWRSEWSFAEADARAFNALLRRVGLNPAPTERWPADNRTKALLWRAWRKVARPR